MKNLLKKSFGILVVTMVGYGFANAQADFSINGLGRSILSNNQLKGNILNADTATGRMADTLSTRKGAGGYNLFDLGFNFKKGLEFKTNALLRVKQPFGDFWGEQTKFEFRQLQVMGDLRWLKYELGDIDVKMTPYTVYNADEMYHTFESSIYKARRDIVDYENFNKNNVWRLQGLKLGTGLYFENKYVNELIFKGFGVRTNGTNDFTTADRLLTGLSTDIVSQKYATIGFNYVGLNDIRVSRTYGVDYSNNIFTSTADIKVLDKDILKINLVGEGGTSNRNYLVYAKDTTTKDTTEVAKDYFVDGGVQVKFKKLFSFNVSYKNVGLNYSSPSAQTTRYNIAAAPALFGKVLSNTANRQQLLFDRFTQEAVYNRTLSTTLNSFNPIFNNITPYGEATPNRKGITLALASADSLAVKFYAQARFFTEITGEGTTLKRNFKALTTGVQISLAKLLKFDRPIDISFGDRYEKTDRGADTLVNLTSNIVDAGLVIGVFKQLDFMLGQKYLTAKGRELVSNRTVLNELGTPTNYNVDATQKITSIGFRINFNETANFVMNYNLVDASDKKMTAMNYTMNQLFVNFNIIF